MGVLQDLERLIAPVELIQATGTPTVSIALLENGKISSHVITGGGENTETMYECCSISKAITAICVAKLVDEGRMAYEDKVVDYLPKHIIDIIVEPSTAYLMQHVTVAMLLSHTSGLSQHGFPGYPEAVPSTEEVLSGHAPSNTPRIRFISFPGAQFAYSGGGFTVLQAMLENRFKIGFAQMMHDMVLQPLGMTRSHYGGMPSAEKNYALPYQTAYTLAPTGAHTFPELAAAGLWTTPTDLLRAVSALQGSTLTDSGFLSEATAEKMLSPVPNIIGSIGSVSIGGIGSDLNSMGLGWGVGGVGFAHGGSNDPGYRCYVFGSHNPQNLSENSSESDTGALLGAEVGFCIMTNSVLGEDCYVKVLSALFYLKKWRRITIFPGGLGPDNWVPYPAPAGAEPHKSWKEWAGKWEGGWKIEDEGGPTVTLGSLQPMRLGPAAGPVQTVGEEQEVLLVVDGLDTAFRLTWEDGERVVQLIQREVRTLKREA